MLVTQEAESNRFLRLVGQPTPAYSLISGLIERKFLKKKDQRQNKALATKPDHLTHMESHPQHLLSQA